MDVVQKWTCSYARSFALVQRAIPLGLRGVGYSDLTKSLAFAAGSPGQDSCCTDPSVDSELETLRRRSQAAATESEPEA